MHGNPPTDALKSRSLLRSNGPSCVRASNSAARMLLITFSSKLLPTSRHLTSAVNSSLSTVELRT